MMKVMAARLIIALVLVAPVVHLLSGGGAMPPGVSWT